MFHTIRQSVLKRMQYLEQTDIKDREDNLPRLQRLRQIPPETGRFLALLAATVPNGNYLEIGSSGGYSTLWIATACEELGRKLTTFEISSEKIKLARQTLELTQMENIVTVVEGDARQHLVNYDQIAFCFLDADKDVYSECYETIVPKMIKGGILVADNVISHREILQPLVDKVLADERVDALVVPIGKGELVCRKL